MAIEPDELKADIIYQVGALLGFCISSGVPLRHVKPHGALYNMAAVDRKVAQATVSAVQSLDKDLVLFAPCGSALEMAGQEAGLRVAREAFADRLYDGQGRLVARSLGGILTPERAAKQALDIAIGKGVHAENGDWLPISADTLCVHGDGKHALETARAVNRALKAAGVVLRPVFNPFQNG